jgi:CRP-like cAMP-binding protein
MSDSIFALLKKNKFFEHFDDTTLRYLSSRARKIEIKERAVVWRHGSRADRLLVLLSGRCKLRRLTPSSETIIDIVVAGEVAGELAFALNDDYKADLVAAA